MNFLQSSNQCQSSIVFYLPVFLPLVFIRYCAFLVALVRLFVSLFKVAIFGNNFKSTRKLQLRHVLFSYQRLFLNRFSQFWHHDCASNRVSLRHSYFGNLVVGGSFQVVFAWITFCLVLGWINVASASRSVGVERCWQSLRALDQFSILSGWFVGSVRPLLIVCAQKFDDLPQINASTSDDAVLLHGRLANLQRRYGKKRKKLYPTFVASVATLLAGAARIQREEETLRRAIELGHMPNVTELFEEKCD